MEGDLAGLIDGSSAPPFEGTSANETVLGTDGDETLDGMDGDDVIRSGLGDDIVVIDQSYTGETLWEDMAPGDMIRFVDFDCALDVPY